MQQYVSEGCNPILGRSPSGRTAALGHRDWWSGDHAAIDSTMFGPLTAAAKGALFLQRTKKLSVS